MRHLKTTILVVLLSFGAAGCTCSALKDQAQKSVTASDQYAKLVQSTFDGSIQPADGAPVTTADLAATPPSVRKLLANVVRALYMERYAWYQANFALKQGPDPSTLQLDPPAFPGGN